MGNKFGILPSGEITHLYTICSGSYAASFTDVGATWVSFLAPDRKGCISDVVLGYDTPQEYVIQDGCMGAVIGRSANRIGGAGFVLDGKEVKLATNEGSNNLHSGPDAWYTRLWTVENQCENSLTFGLDTPDGDQGYPGAGHVRVSYTLESGTLTVSYEGIFDQKTIFNPTQHVYLNLAGHECAELAMKQELTVCADQFTPVTAESISTGEIASVSDTALDFRLPKVLGTVQDEPLLAPQGGLDHNFVLTAPGLSQMAAQLMDPGSGRVLRVYTDCPGIQVYTANFLNTHGKKGANYSPRSGVCLETQFFPNSVNVPQWPQSIAEAGCRIVRTTRFAFSVDQ